MRSGPALLLGLLVAATALAQSGGHEEPWPDPGSVLVAPEELAFRPRRFDAATSESLFLVARFNDGWVLMASVFEFRTALFHRWGIYAAVASPAGDSRWLQLEIDPADVRTDPTRMYLTDGRNTVDAGSDSCRVVLELPGLSCDLSVRYLLSPWRGGDGVDVMSRDGRAFASRILACPWGEVTGAMTLDGRTTAVRGQGLLEKCLIVNPLNRLDPLLYSIRAWSDDEVPPEERWFVGLLDVTTHEAYGAERIPRMEVAKAGAWLFATRDYTLEALEPERGAGLPYPAPRRIRVTARGGGYLLRAEYTAGVLFSFTDVLADLPKWVRPIVSLFLKRPVYYRFLGELAGTVTFPDGHVEPIRLRGPYEYVIAR